ncbi:MAG TPA: O-methyltransferase [Micromonosporaceae bacterium]
MGLNPIQPAAGAVLRMLAATSNARAVVEIGTGTGVSGLWLLGGLRPDGILTTIDVEAEHQRIARRAFLDAGYAPSRTRLITGRALEVLPRLADGAYDLVFVDSQVDEYPACVEYAHRLLRPGGLLILHGALAGGRVGDPAARDTATVMLREVMKTIRDDGGWVPALLPVGAGLLCAVRR